MIATNHMVFSYDFLSSFRTTSDVFSWFIKKLFSVFGFQGSKWKVSFPMGLSGLEPPTSRLSGVRSNHLSYEPIYLSLKISGGDERDRTDDPLLAKQVLSQLSYTPVRTIHL